LASEDLAKAVERVWFFNETVESKSLSQITHTSMGKFYPGLYSIVPACKFETESVLKQSFARQFPEGMLPDRTTAK